MEEWLKKLIEGLKGPGAGTGSNPMGPGGTPMFNPNVVGTPLHSSVPDPDRPLMMQTRGVNGAPSVAPVHEAYNTVPNSPPSTVTGNTTVNPLESALATARGDYQKAVAEPAHKQNPWLQALFQGLQLTQRVADPSNPANAQPVQWLGEAKKADRVRKAAGTLAPLEAQQERMLGERYKKAQTENIYADNSRMEAERQDRATKAANDLMERKRTNFYKQNKNFSVKNATPAQKRQLAEIGETPESIGDYDFTKRDFKTVGGVTYKWNENEKAFVDTNAVKDPTKAFTQVKVKDPETKEVHTFVTTEEKAAQMMNSRAVAGLQIEAAERRQLNQQNFQEGENSKTRQFQSTIEAAKMQFRTALKQFDAANGRQKTLESERSKFIRAYKKENGSAPTEDEVNNYLADVTGILDESEE